MMKKSFLIILAGVMLIIISTFSSAITSDMKSTYMRGETGVVKLSGAILEPISKEQVEFKKENVRMPFIYDIIKLGDEYYLWFIVSTGASEGNYSVNISNIFTYVAGTTKKVDYVNYFNVSTQLADYSINPGAVFAKSNFTITITSYKDDVITLNIDKPQSRNYEITPGSNNIELDIKKFPGTELTTIKVGTYTIPAYIINGNNIIEGKKNNSISVNPGIIDVNKLKSTKKINFSIDVENIGLNNISDLYIEFNDSAFKITPNKKDDLNIDETREYVLSISDSYRTDIDEIIIIKSDKNNISMEVPIRINFINNYTELVNNTNQNNNSYITYTCSELFGKICNSNQNCNGESVFSSDGQCCTGVCEAKSTEKKSNAGIGYLLAIVLVAILGYLYYSYRRVKVDKDPIKTQIRESEKKKKVP